MLSSNNEMYTDAMGTVVNCNESITLRSAPDTGARELMQIPLGAEVTYVARRGDFYEVIYDGIYGYALASYIYIEPTESAGRIVNCDESVALMKSPDLSSGELCQVPLNAPVHYITTYGYDFTDMDWYLVIYDGMVGYIYGDHVQWD